MEASGTTGPSWLEGIEGIDELEADLHRADASARPMEGLAPDSAVRGLYDRQTQRCADLRSRRVSPINAERAQAAVELTHGEHGLSVIEQFVSLHSQLAEAGYGPGEALDMTYFTLKTQAVLRSADAVVPLLDDIAGRYRQDFER